MTEAEIQNYYELAYENAIAVGQMMRNGYISTKMVKAKAAAYDLVTEYDMQIEQYLMRKISEKYPDHKFIGEETTAEEKFLPELTDTPTWIIDPIDGTSNFIKNIPHVCVSIALAVNKKLVLGIIFNPIANELYTARKGQGAFYNGQRIYASDCSEIQKAICAYEPSLAHPIAIRHKHCKRSLMLAAKAMGTRAFGCAALSLCYVAKGSLDGYAIEDLYPWDMAAGVVIIREAGGVVYNSSGGEFNVMDPSIVCASTEQLGREMVSIIQKADEINLPDFV